MDSDMASYIPTYIYTDTEYGKLFKDEFVD
jgi:hypothetical protein